MCLSANLVAEPVELHTATGTIYGTLILPIQSSPMPVALLISGSGPTDRDGNSAMLPGKNNSLKYLAEALAEKGIASLRYDKRGIGQSRSAGLNESDLRFEQYAQDAAGWCDSLKKDKRFNSVWIIGHSEGSFIGMIAARETPVNGFISIAGIGVPAAQTIRMQLQGKVDAQTFSKVDSILNLLEKGKPVETIPPEPLFASLFRSSVQPYLISWFKYDPAKEIAKLKIPLLVIQGTTDIQVREEDARILSQSNPNARLEIIDGMNHVLKQVPVDLTMQQKSYMDPDLPIDASLVRMIAAFIQKN
jgi:pimeloyl-ACP methyl ester carboxylesterase